MIYRFIGSFAELGDRTVLETFGQSIELAPETAEFLVSVSNVALIPEKMWAARKITAEELKQFPAIALHPAAPHPFTAKRDALWADLRAWRDKLQATAATPAEKVGE